MAAADMPSKLSKRQDPEKLGCNTFGAPIESHIKAIRDQYTVYLETIRSVRDYLNNPDEQLHQGTDWKQIKFAYMCMKPLCKGADGHLIPAEFSIVVYSFENGIIEVQSGFIHARDIPFGGHAEMADTVDENGYPQPGTAPDGKYALLSPGRFMTMIVNLANKYGLFKEDEFLFFTTRSDLPVVHSCLMWILLQTGHSKSLFHIISFEVLLMEMSSRVVPKDSVGVIKHEGGAGRFIYHPRYDFCLNLGCEWHRSTKKGVEKLDRCANNIAMRRVYNALYYLCHLYQVLPLKSGTHCPPPDDTDEQPGKRRQLAAK